MNTQDTTQQAPGTAPSDAQIDAMLQAIFGKSDRATATDNADLYGAHTDVLQNRLSADDARSKYGVPAEGSDEAQFSDDELGSITNTADWHGGNSPDGFSPDDSFEAFLAAAEADDEDDEDDDEGAEGIDTAEVKTDDGDGC